MTELVNKRNELERIWKAKVIQLKALPRYLIAVSEKKLKIKYTSPQTEI